MKIQIREKGKCFTIPLPNALVFNRFVLRLVVKETRMSPEAANRLLWELRRLGRRAEPWELVRVEAKNGEVISITI